MRLSKRTAAMKFEELRLSEIQAGVEASLVEVICESKPDSCSMLPPLGEYPEASEPARHLSQTLDFPLRLRNYFQLFPCVII